MRATVEICGHPFHAVVEGDTVTFATFGEPPEEPLVDDDHPVASALRAYAAGDVVALERIAVRQPGSEFRQRVWAELRTVAPGAPISYTELAGRAGRPAAVRAAASGCATNRIPLIVPCHRVVRADGGLGGYAFGLDLKRLLLEHEARR
ncbi:MAG: methylated-DNA--[protein]-cysteine S-methyltransferase [Actinomyces sp.]|uniref:methylated-DNA--[protein]-cysteine S-methyltransferase n=1 Tax=Actinomyces sp. TaxID=29317 RepID=UPI0026DC380B|nr:methylated-DNA--[protein]-cysteine S-methyltransferase [Actinomyces sp.]MDO4243085.1 methylated-DNA--[protein]-cysteine S-methyltransferase [Actinomyces sp.]